MFGLLTALGRFAEYVGAVVFLSAFGWLSGFMLAQMYKIVAFLTWLEVYGPVLGKAPTPRVPVGRRTAGNALVHALLCRRMGRIQGRCWPAARRYSGSRRSQ